ncbi:MAG: hypothetical protein M3Z29_00100 [Pseudomonadota bacterium]|nr:hypothetical protein [Pseudomonadota bacterium]
MARIESARMEVFEQARAMLAMHEGAMQALAAPALPGAEPQAAPADSGLAMTPAQDLAFFARSSSWRCTACGRVQVFAQRVSVAHASPCACASIEFEPQRERSAAGAGSLEQVLPQILGQ